MICYTVKPGDSLWKIANSFQVDLDALIAANPQLNNVNQISIGETIHIPEIWQPGHPMRPEPREEAQIPINEDTVMNTIERPCIYTAHDGETLESISHSFMVPLSRMLYYNLKYSRGESLKEGCRVILPESEIQPVSPIHSNHKAKPFFRR